MPHVPRTEYKSGLPTSSTTMASPPPKGISKIQRWGKAPRRVFNQVRDSILPSSRPSSPFPGTCTANIPNDVPGVVRDQS